MYNTYYLLIYNNDKKIMYNTYYFNICFVSYILVTIQFVLR